MTKEEIMAMEAGKPLDEIIHTKIFGVDVEKKRRTFSWVNVPDYSKDISKAWNIVEKLQPTLWVRMNSMMDEHYCGIGSPDMLWEYKSKSMPECICKAALLAVMES